MAPRPSESRSNSRLPANGSLDRLPADFYAQPVVDLAQQLIGCELTCDGVGGVIVETEAYHDTDQACHAYNGPTPRSSLLFGVPGLAYVYFSYGMHTLFNVVAEPEGIGAAVLIRAVEPRHGIDQMILRRKRPRAQDLCSGPAKLTQALGIGLNLNGSSLSDGPISICPGDGMPLRAGKRIGISKAVDLQWRFCAVGSPYVSKPWI